MQQCPSCQYELTMKEQVENPESCPKCGIYFEKFLAKQAALKEAALSDAGRSGGIAGAREGLREVRSKRVAQERERSEARANPAYVSVVDFSVPFWSLVWFLVKLAFAAIPAAIIVWVIVISAGAVVSGFNEYSRIADASNAARSESPAGSGREEQCRSVELYAETVMTARQDGASMSSLIGDGASERTKRLIGQAFDRPRFDFPVLREREISEFKNKHYLECIRGY